ncbi:ester cyclase [Streptomonospora sp. PA3]|uniref:ester cyclase n=1 Tax=Streptomonospora sp. PA3 TaxID=2607326 RepID=UPI0031BBCA64
MNRRDAAEICHRQFFAMSQGGFSAFAELVHAEGANRMAVQEPLVCRGRGPAAFHATSTLLRAVFAGLTWDVHEVVADGDLVVAHATMSGRQVGTFFSYDERGAVRTAFPSTGRRFSVTQTHWWRLADGVVYEHWANRDDLALGLQLGWVRPSLRYAARMALAMTAARRAESRNGGPLPGGHRP